MNLLLHIFVFFQFYSIYIIRIYLHDLLLAYRPMYNVTHTQDTKDTRHKWNDEKLVLHLIYDNITFHIFIFSVSNFFSVVCSTRVREQEKKTQQNSRISYNIHARTSFIVCFMYEKYILYSCVSVCVFDWIQL